MIGAFNRVSPLFRELTGRHLPRIYIRDALSQNLDIGTNHDNVISVMKLYKTAGQNSGLARCIKELLSNNRNWMRAWMILRHIIFGQYEVKDFFLEVTTVR